MAFSFILVSCEKDKLDFATGDGSGEFATFGETFPPDPMVDPVKYETGAGGNVTCEEVAEDNSTEFDLSTGRLNWEDGEFDGSWPVGLSVTVTDDTYVSFEITGPFEDGKCYLVGAVIVKGSNAANVYYYADGADSDEGLRSPLNTGGQQSELSNLTFCFFEVECPVDEECEWIGETAWAANGDEPGYLRYNITTNSRGNYTGNWATFAEFADKKEVTLFAGQTLEAGTVLFEEINGDVKITITLNEGWRLEEDEYGEVVSEAVKIQGYNESPQGYENPSPGLFTTYKGEELVVTVDKYDFYGVHLNVQWQKCE